MLSKVVICGVDTSGLPKLSHKEQDELMRRLKAGDEKARELLPIRAALGFVKQD